MDSTTNLYEISIQPVYGPRFFRASINDGDNYDFFEHRIDSRNCVGPRIATKQDKTSHPKLWAAYQAALTAELDAGLVGNAPGSVNAEKDDMPAFLKRKKGK
jgi:hypothetical protein